MALFRSIEALAQRFSVFTSITSYMEIDEESFLSSAAMLRMAVMPVITNAPAGTSGRPDHESASPRLNV